MNSLALTNAGLTGTIYFRIYGYGASGSGGTWRIDNLNVQGNVAGAGGVTGTGWYVDTVSVRDFACCVNSTPPPVASFTGSPTSGVVPLSVTFSDTSTGSITNWSWNFGDGGTTNVTTNSVLYAYNTAGVYSVTEIVSGPGGSSTNTQVNYITALTPFQAWQIQYFGSTTNPAAAANADPLGKGMSNFNQFLAGINPTNPASAFRITSAIQQGSDVLLTWTTAGSYTNVVQVNTGLPDGSYSTNFLGFERVDRYLRAAAIRSPTISTRVALPMLPPDTIVSGSSPESGSASNTETRLLPVRCQASGLRRTDFSFTV